MITLVERVVLLTDRRIGFFALFQTTDQAIAGGTTTTTANEWVLSIFMSEERPECSQYTFRNDFIARCYATIFLWHLANILQKQKHNFVYTLLTMERFGAHLINVINKVEIDFNL